MKMKEVIARLVQEFGPADTTQPGPLVDRIVQVIGDRDVPDATFRKIVSLGNVLKGVGVPR